MTTISTSSLGRIARQALLAACLVTVAVPAGFAVGTDGGAFAQSAGGGNGGGRGAGGSDNSGDGGGNGAGMSEAMAFIKDKTACTAGAACQPERPERPVRPERIVKSCGDHRDVNDPRFWNCERDRY